MNQQLPPPDPDDSSQLPPPVYEVEEQPVERRINSDSKHVEIIDGKEVIVERRRSPASR